MLGIAHKPAPDDWLERWTFRRTWATAQGYRLLLPWLCHLAGDVLPQGV
jgi:hypothetical protein